MLIDWFSARIGLDQVQGHVRERLLQHVGRVMSVDSDGVLRWEKAVLDFDALRSDTPGLCWQCSGDPKEGLQLVVGASPATLLHGNNVFGSIDIVEAAQTIINHAAKALGAILPGYKAWSCRRLDVTANYDLGGPKEVKAALRHLMGCDASRQKAQGDAGDSVYWGKGSDLIGGKAYHKGPQMERLRKRWCKLDDEERRKSPLQIHDWMIEKADNLLRLELMLKSRWWRRFYEDGGKWWELTGEKLTAMHNGYFGKFIGRVEVADMGQLLEELEKVAPTKGQALAAHRTWALIKSVKFDQARESMPRATWFRHLKLLRSAGVSDADLFSSEIIPFRRSVLEISAPVMSWEEIRRAA